MTVDAPAQPSGTMDVDEFMAFLDTRPGKERWDLIDGVAIKMAPATLADRQIAFDFAELLNRAFAATKRDLFAYCSVCVRTTGVRNFQAQPDVAVLPGVAGYELYSERLQLVGEILSPSNTRAEIDLKLRRYREAPDNLYAVVIEPREFLVEIHAKRYDWRPAILKRPNDTVEMPEFGLSCRVVDLYRGTPLDPQRAAV